jgi:hypothetical protein
MVQKEHLFNGIVSDTVHTISMMIQCNENSGLLIFLANDTSFVYRFIS